MTLTLIIILSVSTLWLLTVFLFYPFGIALLAKIRPRPIAKGDENIPLPPITFVMAAFNEELVIERRIRNYQNLDYPREKLRFIIGSDASSDRTDEIISSIIQSDPTIELRRFSRSGKTKIVYTIASEIREGIIIFTDADIVMTPDSVRHIVRCFADPEVGGVVSHVIYEEIEENAGSVGERNYHTSEDKIRYHESLVHSTIRPTGQCFSVRPESYTPIKDYRMSDDLNLAITVALNGYRVWFEPKAEVVEVNRRTLETEMIRRFRMGQQAMASFLQYEGTRWPWRSWTGLKIWTGKLLRNLAGIPVLLFWISAILLAILDGHVIFLLSGALSAFWILLVLLGRIADRLGLSLPLLAYPLYFTSMLVALTIGSLRAFTRGGGLAMWSTPRIKSTNNE